MHLDAHGRVRARETERPMVEDRWTLHEGDCLEAMRAMPALSVDHVITDPPYSERTHKGVRGHGTRPLRGGNGKHIPRVVDLGFGHAGEGQIFAWTEQFARLARRWVLIFCDLDLVPLWRRAGAAYGLRYVQTCLWDRIGGAPQFDGLGPAVPCEFIVCFHNNEATTRRWNGGGKRGIYSHPIVANRVGHRADRVHTTQKPEALMLDLVRDFTDEDELVLDPFTGSGTTGVACLRAGRRFAGLERDPDIASTARNRLTAETKDLTLASYLAKQVPLFGKK